MKIADVIKEIENFAPPSLQESYDNAGLIVGDRNLLLKGILICLDSIEAVVDEAIAKDCNLIVAHHPIVFAGLKRFNGNNYIERIIIKAIKNDIAIYAAHTNLDNVADGVNAMIARKIGLSNTKILSPKANIVRKLHTYVPTDHLANIQDAIFKAGAGHIGNYDECSFSFEGKGSFRAGDHANAFVGQKGQRHFEPETKIEVIYPSYNERKVISALKLSHPYEEVAYHVIPINTIKDFS